MADLTDLKKKRGDNTPGLMNIIYIGVMSTFLVIKGVKKTAGIGDSVTVDGTHTFVDGEGFLKCYTTQDTQQFKLDPTGERDSRGKKIAFEFFHPGNSKEVAEFDRQIKNDEAIILVTTPDGEVLQLGSEGLGVEILGAYDSAKLSGGKRGFTFKVEGYANGLLFYEGDIDLKSGTTIPGTAAPVV